MNAQGSKPTASPKYRVCIIAIYLGKPPGWLPVWLRSCEMNPQFEFLLLSDRPGEIPFCPGNVRVEGTTLAELKGRISAAVGFDVALGRPHKLCDFKPAYGAFLSDLLKPYDFWGHTDIDLFYGDLASFISREALENNVRLYHRGHLSFFRNDPEGNNLYRLPHPTVDWREVFRSEKYWSFDESYGIEELVRFHKIPEFANNDAIADMVPKFPSLRLARNGLNRRHQVFVFENGAARQIYMEHGRAIRRDFMYVHIQKRKFPDVDARLWRSVSSWVSTPQGFVANAPAVWTESELRRFNRPNYRHSLMHVWRRTARRLNKRERETTS